MTAAQITMIVTTVASIGAALVAYLKAQTAKILADDNADRMDEHIATVEGTPKVASVSSFENAAEKVAELVANDVLKIVQADQRYAPVVQSLAQRFLSELASVTGQPSAGAPSASPPLPQRQ